MELNKKIAELKGLYILTEEKSKTEIVCLDPENMFATRKDYENNIADAWELLEELKEYRTDIMLTWLEDYQEWHVGERLTVESIACDKKASMAITKSYIEVKENEKDTTKEG